jgi:hypothetical protein
MTCNRLFAVLSLMVFAECTLAQKREPPDNFTVFQGLFDKVAAQVTHRLPVDHQAIPVVVAPAVEVASAAAMLRARVVKIAIDRGHTVFGTDSLSGSRQFIRISFPFVNCAVEYTQVKGGFLWRRGTMRRQAMIELNAEVVEEPATRILLQEFFRADFADTVRSSDLSSLEDPQHEFTVGREPRRSGWAQVMEPLLLIVSTGAAAYALYALRSR